MLPDFRIRQRDYLLEIARAMSQELNLDKLLARIVHISAEMLAGQAGLIALRKEKGGWEVATSQGIPASFLRYLNVLMAQVQNHENPARFELPEINRLLQELTQSTSLGLLAGVGIPLIAFERLIGVIYIFRGYLDGFSSNDRALLQSFADQAAIAVNNALQYTQITRDKQRMDALLDTVADGMLILAANRTIERCNPAFERMLGVPKQNFLGKTHDEVILWKKRNQGMTLEEAEAGGWPLVPNAILYVEGDLARANGASLPVGITYAPLLSQDGTLINTIATVRDITHFRELDEVKSTFISVISHELKTPVALIKGYVATLRREDATWNQEIVHDSLQVIEEEADRLAEMIENLLDASRLQAGGLKLNQSDLSVVDLVKRLVERFRTQSDRHTFIVDFPANFPSILGDEERLTQVFSNLISNAIKYSAEGGEIRLTGQEKAEEVVICVADEGPGIAPGDAPFIFDRFYRASDASRTTKGAGLGLYLTRALVDAHGGKIWIDTRYRGGARICISLPH